MVAAATAGNRGRSSDCHRPGGATNPSKSSGSAAKSPPLGLLTAASRVAIASQRQRNPLKAPRRRETKREWRRDEEVEREKRVRCLLSIAPFSLSPCRASQRKNEKVKKNRKNFLQGEKIKRSPAGRSWRQRPLQGPGEQKVAVVAVAGEEEEEEGAR